AWATYNMVTTARKARTIDLPLMVASYLQGRDPSTRVVFAYDYDHAADAAGPVMTTVFVSSECRRPFLSRPVASDVRTLLCVVHRPQSELDCINCQVELA